MFDTYFTPEQSWPLFPSLACIILAIILFEFRNDKRAAVFLLILGAFGLRLFTILLDPFLNHWDEQFHALVAKNMMDDPFRPMLYKDPVLPYEHFRWDRNHIWLHKQPLFLWQIALSFKIFGANELALRLPSLILSTLTVLLTWRIGQIAFNERAAFCGALLMATGYYVLKFVSGQEHTDHNDVAFLFCVTASLWTFCEYEASPKKRWIILIGLFAGMAVLTKWLTGLLVFSGWGISILLDKQKRYGLKHYKDLLIALVISLVVFLPWQLYILSEFPLEAKQEYAYNSAHFTEEVEGHGGTYWYHLENLAKQYGVMAPYLFFPALFFLFRALKGASYKAAFTTWIVIVFTFFTLAKTKMPGFTMMISPLVCLAFGALLQILVPPSGLIKPPLRAITRLFTASVLIFISLWSLNLKEIQITHTSWDHDKNLAYYRKQRIEGVKMAKEMPQEWRNNQHVIFNCHFDDRVQIMFYSGITAYDHLLSETQLDSLKRCNLRVIAFDNGTLPDFLKNDSAVIKFVPPKDH